MKLPEGATEIEITFPLVRGDRVYIVFGGFGKEWAVWDTRPVRQGARLISDGHSFDEACQIARVLATK